MHDTLHTADQQASERSIGPVRPSHRSALLLAVVTALLTAGSLAGPTTAARAARVLVLAHGHVRVEHDPFVPTVEEPALALALGRAATPRARASRGPSVRAVLAELLDRGAIDQVEYDQRLTSYTDALGSRGNLSGTRRRELASVISNLDSFAARGLVTVSRLEVLFLTLDRNREWWTTGSIPAARSDVRFAGSRVIFRYFPGQGIQIHPLANWGRANGLYEGHYDQSLQEMLDELVPLGVDRAGGTAWEYYFYFGGGRPPWVSGLSQGTALQALARAGERLDEPAYTRLANSGLGVFSTPTPAGIRVRTRWGAHYVQYSYAPRYRVLNGFIQSLNGLYDMASITHSARARALFRAGDREARHEIPYYDTGRWSRYDSTGILSDTHYHALLRDFLYELCRRTHTGIYCATAARFTRYLRLGYPPPRRRR